MRRGFDPLSFVAGLVLVTLGGLLLADRLGDVELGFGWTTPAVLAACGAILLTVGLTRRRP
jgi:hypothetical protein